MKPNNFFSYYSIASILFGLTVLVYALGFFDTVEKVHQKHNPVVGVLANNFDYKPVNIKYALVFLLKDNTKLNVDTIYTIDQQYLYVRVMGGVKMQRVDKNYVSKIFYISKQ